MPGDSGTPLLVYDGECAFCRRWIARWQARTGDRVHFVPLEEPGLLEELRISRRAALRSVQLIMPTGERYEGAQAVLRALGQAPGLHAISRIARLPVVRLLTEGAYRLIARHRLFAERVDRLIFG